MNIYCLLPLLAVVFLAKMGCTEIKAVRTSGLHGTDTCKSLYAQAGNKIVLGKYKMILGADGILGEGASSICFRGTVMGTGEPVAIKLYKTGVKLNGKSLGKQATQDKLTNNVKFHRQIQVLTDLQKPFNPDHCGSAGQARILRSNPAHMFVQLFDFTPRQCLEKYIVTEVGEHTLKSVLRQHSAANRVLKRNQIWHVSQALVLAAGGLHEKGLVHLDIKPENVMLFGDRWKLIDVDGCMRVSEQVSCNDTTLSFSPCYCAPEWARFVMSTEKSATMKIDSSLDSWSMGMTLAEVVTLEAPLKPMFNQIVRNVGLQEQSSVTAKFIKYIGRMEEVPLPRCLHTFHAGFAKMIRLGLLRATPSGRLSMADCLEEEFMRPVDLSLSECRPHVEASFGPDEYQTSSLSWATTKYTSAPGSAAETPQGSPIASPRLMESNDTPEEHDTMYPCHPCTARNAKGSLPGPPV